MSQREKNKVYNTIGLSPSLSMPAKGDANSTTSSAVAQGTIDIRENPTQDISALSRNTANSLNELSNNYTTTRLRAILPGSSAPAASAAFETLIDLNGEISPAQLMIALNHDIAIHHGKGLVVEKSDWEALPE